MDLPVAGCRAVAAAESAESIANVPEVMYVAGWIVRDTSDRSPTTLLRSPPFFWISAEIWVADAVPVVSRRRRSGSDDASVAVIRFRLRDHVRIASD